MKKLGVVLYIMLTAFRMVAQGNIQNLLGNNIYATVAKDGSGNYATIQSAINAFPNNNTSVKVIFVKSGTYTEKVEIPSSKTNLMLVGENVDNTIITYNDYSGSGKVYNGIISSANGVAIGTSTSHTLYVASNDFTMMNITVRNSAGDVGQAVALNSNGDRHILYHCKLVGYQDTYYTWAAGRFYIKDCYVEGAIDYIFGRGVALFDSCQIHSLRSSSYITAAATDQDFKYGYVFKNCKLTSTSGISSVFLGRPWKAYGQTVFMHTEEGAFLNIAGWSQWSGNTNHNTCYYAEYKNCGEGSPTSSRVTWSHQLTDIEASNFTIGNMFDKNVNPSPYATSWIPNLATNNICQIVKNNTTRFITSACFSGTCTPFVWYADTDGDTHGDPNISKSSCTQPAGFVADNSDQCPNDATKVSPGLCGCGHTENSCTDCNGVINGTASVDACDRCVGGNTGKVACVGVSEAETEACSFDGVVESKNLGYKGIAYINVENIVGAQISFSINTDVAEAKSLSIRYASASDRPAAVKVNGTLLLPNFNFPSTGSFTTYKTIDLNIAMVEGQNIIQFVANTTEGLANLDQIGFLSQGLVKGDCIVTSFIDTEDPDNRASVYPNPSNAGFTINGLGTYICKVTDLSGYTIWQGQIQDTTILGNLWASGIYFLYKDGIVTKLVKE